MAVLIGIVTLVEQDQLQWTMEKEKGVAHAQPPHSALLRSSLIISYVTLLVENFENRLLCLRSIKIMLGWSGAVCDGVPIKFELRDGRIGIS